MAIEVLRRLVSRLLSIEGLKVSWNRFGKSRYFIFIEFMFIHFHWLMDRSKGYSQILHTKHYAFLSNACVNVRNGQITLHMKSDMMVNKLIGEYKWKDFYCKRLMILTNTLVNPFKVVTTPLSERQLVKKPMQLLVAHPRSVRNAYQFLEGTSMLAHIAMHPEIFPSVDYD